MKHTMGTRRGLLHRSASSRQLTCRCKHCLLAWHRQKEPLPIEIQLGSNAVTLTSEGWKLGEYLRIYIGCAGAQVQIPVGGEGRLSARKGLWTMGGKQKHSNMIPWLSVLLCWPKPCCSTSTAVCSGVFTLPQQRTVVETAHHRPVPLQYFLNFTVHLHKKKNTGGVDMTRHVGSPQYSTRRQRPNASICYGPCRDLFCERGERWRFLLTTIRASIKPSVFGGKRQKSPHIPSNLPLRNGMNPLCTQVVHAISQSRLESPPASHPHPGISPPSLFLLVISLCVCSSPLHPVLLVLSAFMRVKSMHSFIYLQAHAAKSRFHGCSTKGWGFRNYLPHFDFFVSSIFGSSLTGHFRALDAYYSSTRQYTRPRSTKIIPLSMPNKKYLL